MINNAQDAKIKLVANIRQGYTASKIKPELKKIKKGKKQDTVNLQRPTTRRKSISAV